MIRKFHYVKRIILFMREERYLFTSVIIAVTCESNDFDIQQQ